MKGQIQECFLTFFKTLTLFDIIINFLNLTLSQGKSQNNYTVFLSNVFSITRGR